MENNCKKTKEEKKTSREDLFLNHSHQYLSFRGAWSHTFKQHRPKTYPLQTLSWVSVVPFSAAILQVQDQLIQAVPPVSILSHTTLMQFPPPTVALLLQ